MAFSDEFLMGLATKSDGFQQQFFGIMEKFFSFFDYNEDDVDAFQNDIEECFSYYEQGNQLFWRGGYVGGEPSLDRKDEYMEELISTLTELFQEDRDWDGENGMYTATHIIIAVRCPKGVMTETEVDQLNFLLTLERPIDTGVSQILCKHRRAVKNRAKIICWGGGLSATP